MIKGDTKHTRFMRWSGFEISLDSVNPEYFLNLENVVRYRITNRGEGQAVVIDHNGIKINPGIAERFDSDTLFPLNSVAYKNNSVKSAQVLPPGKKILVEIQYLTPQ